MVDISVDDALDLFARLAEKEAEVRAMQLDTGAKWLACVRKEAELNAFFDGGKAGDFIRILDRPRDPDDAWVAEAKERPPKPRTIHAATLAEVEGETVALVYCASTRVDLECYDRFTVAMVGTAWRTFEPKIVSYYVSCGECRSKLGIALNDDPEARLAGCGVCGQQGFEFANTGHKHRKPKPTGEVRRLAEPSDRTALRIYETL